MKKWVIFCAMSALSVANSVPHKAAIAATEQTAIATTSPLRNRYQWHVPPFRVIGNIYYIGLNEYASWLIVTSEGYFLLDDEVPAETQRDLEQLGFDVHRIKYILVSHAHTDCVLGIQEIHELAGAPVVAMRGDLSLLRTGAAFDNHIPGLSPGPNFPPVTVAKVIRDRDSIRLGDVILTAHLTAGHTPGSTTWTTVVEENGRYYKVAFVGGAAALSHPLVGNRDYPKIARDWKHSFKVLRSLHADVLLAEHASTFHLEEKLDLMKQHPGTNPFIDPSEYERFVVEKEIAFNHELQKEEAGSADWAPNVEDYGKCPPDGRACYNIYDLIASSLVRREASQNQGGNVPSQF